MFGGQPKTLIEAKRATVEPTEEAVGGAAVLGRLAGGVGRIGQQFVGAAAFIVDLPGVVSRATSSGGEPAIQRALLDFVMALVAVLAVAIIVEWIVRHVLARTRKDVASRSR